MTSSENTIHRVMHEIKHRQLTVLKVVDLTPRMRRITLGGAQLQGFISLGSDDHVKLLFANNPAEQAAMDALDLPKEGVKPTMREYTPRRIDLVNNELDLDFVLHGDGPASTWAAQAKPGHTLNIAGPRGSLVKGGSGGPKVGVDSVGIVCVVVGLVGACRALGRELRLANTLF